MKKNIILLIATLLLCCAMLCGTLLYLGNRAIDVLTFKNFSVELPEEMEEKDLLVAADAADYLKMSQETLLRMVQNGEMEGCYLEDVPGHYVFVRQRLYEWALARSGSIEE